MTGDVSSGTWRRCLRCQRNDWSNIGASPSPSRTAYSTAIWPIALRCDRRIDTALLELRKSWPGDVVIKLSLAELLVTTDPDDKEHAKYVVKMTGRLANECEIHAALLLYKARALRVLGMHTAVRDALTAGLRRKKNRPRELLNALAYERALVYEDLGQKARARSELEKLYSLDPGYEDVAERFGVR